jgi:hypothetical protein
MESDGVEDGEVVGESRNRGSGLLVLPDMALLRPASKLKFRDELLPTDVIIETHHQHVLLESLVFPQSLRYRDGIAIRKRKE